MTANFARVATSHRSFVWSCPSHTKKTMANYTPFCMPKTAFKALCVRPLRPHFISLLRRRKKRSPPYDIELHRQQRSCNLLPCFLLHSDFSHLTEKTFMPIRHNNRTWPRTLFSPNGTKHFMIMPLSLAKFQTLFIVNSQEDHQYSALSSIIKM